MPWQVKHCYGLSTFDSVTAKIQAKGNNIVEATLKIVKNGSYSFCMEGGTSLYVNVETTPCPTCHPTPPSSEMNPHKQAAKPDDVSVITKKFGDKIISFFFITTLYHMLK